MNLIKRYGEDALMGETEIDVTVRARTNLTRQGSSSRGAGSSSSSSKRKRRDSADSDMGESVGFSPSADEASNQSSQWMTLKIATDDSFPEVSASDSCSLTNQF